MTNDDAPAISCPAIWVPEIEPCPTAELAPLIDHLRSNRAVEAQTSFTRGTAMPDGRVDLCKQSLGVDGTARVLAAIDGNPSVRSLLLGTDGLGDEGARLVAAMLSEGRAPALETLYLGCNLIGVDGTKALADAIAAPDTPVRALWLKRNRVGPQGASVLAELLRVQPELSLLDLTNTTLSEAGLAPIVAALCEQAERARGLEHLLVGGNGIGPRGAAELGRLLAITPHLRELSLAVSRLGDDGALALADGLARNRSLERLNLASCGIGAAGAEALATALHRHPKLIELSLGTTPSTLTLGERDNDIGDPGAQALARWLADDPAGLLSLDLRGAGVRSRGALALLAALESNHTLVSLRLGKHVARSIKRRMRTLLQRNAAARGHEPSLPPHVAAILSVYRSKAY